MKKNILGITRSTHKRGIAMIELIFALVIMGIVLLSAPMLIQQSIKSSNIALQQESIAAIATHTSIIMSKHWDEADTNSSLAPILTIAGNTGDFNISNRGSDPITPNNRNTRIGMQNTVGRITTDSVNNLVFASTDLGFGDDNDTGTNTFDDIDDYHGHTATLSSTASSITGDYIDRDISIATQVTYARSSPSAGGLNSTTNLDNFFTTSPVIRDHIKLLSVRLTTSNGTPELDKNISLSAFSCNIGTYQPLGEYK